MRSAYPQQKKNPTAMKTRDQMILRRSSSRCSMSDMDFICSIREGGEPDEEFSSSTSGMSFLGNAAAVHLGLGGDFLSLCRDLAGRRHGAGGGSGRRLYDILGLGRQHLVALFFQAADLVFNLGREFSLGASEFSHHFAQLAAEFRQLARTEQEERQEEDKDEFRLHRMSSIIIPVRLSIHAVVLSADLRGKGRPVPARATARLSREQVREE